MAWKGVADDQSIFVSTFDGETWAPQQAVRGIGTSVGPALAVLGNRLYMIWKGVEGDSNVFYTFIDDRPGAIWQAQRQVEFIDAQTTGMVAVLIGSSSGASIVAVGNSLFAAWKGIPGDSGIWVSSLIDNEWNGQVSVAGVGTSARPAVANLNGRLYMAWKGIEGDSNLFFTTLG